MKNHLKILNYCICLKILKMFDLRIHKYFFRVTFIYNLFYKEEKYKIYIFFLKYKYFFSKTKSVFFSLNFKWISEKPTFFFKNLFYKFLCLLLFFFKKNNCQKHQVPVINVLQCSKSWVMSAILIWPVLLHWASTWRNEGGLGDGAYGNLGLVVLYSNIGLGSSIFSSCAEKPASAHSVVSVLILHPQQ